MSKKVGVSLWRNTISLIGVALVVLSALFMVIGDQVGIREGEIFESNGYLPIFLLFDLDL